MSLLDGCFYRYRNATPAFAAYRSTEKAECVCSPGLAPMTRTSCARGGGAGISCSQSSPLCYVSLPYQQHLGSAVDETRVARLVWKRNPFNWLAGKSIPVHGPRFRRRNWAFVLPRQILRSTDWQILKRGLRTVHCGSQFLSLREGKLYRV